MEVNKYKVILVNNLGQFEKIYVMAKSATHARHLVYDNLAIKYVRQVTQIS